MKLSLVTGTLNRPDSFRRLLDSILRYTETEWEFIVSDASKEPYSGDVPDNVFIHHEKPRLGHTKGYNAAFRSCTGDYVIWLNDDAEVCEGYDTTAIEFMDTHPRIGLGALHYSECGGPFHVNSAWGAIYANFGIFPRELGLKVGFYDEEIEMYGADNSFAFRVLLAGYGIADIPEARILHHSVKDALRQQNQVNRMRDNHLLTKKYIPLKHYWLPVYSKHRREMSIPWSHGLQPVGR